MKTKCSRCGGLGRYIVGPIINGRGRDLGPCYRCGGNGIDPQPHKSSVRLTEQDCTNYCAEFSDACHTCPDCERPNQFGELCEDCRYDRQVKIEQGDYSDELS